MDATDTIDWQTLKERVSRLRDAENQPTKGWLFRGQGNSGWEMITTLERNADSPMLFREYHELICARIAAEVKTYIELEIPQYNPTAVATEYLENNLLGPFSGFPDIDLYRYMIYLRHFGFPSPLLDWSRSPYVAAFFAFRDKLPETGDRSIYIYLSTYDEWKPGDPIIKAIGPYVQTHQRHFRQRSDFTICGQFDENYGWRFASHEEAAKNKPARQALWKFNIPSSERLRVLSELNDYNLNSYSLFGTEESLLETMWLREYVLRRSPGVRRIAAAS